MRQDRLLSAIRRNRGSQPRPRIDRYRLRKLARRLRNTVPTSDFFTERWDREWLSYFRRHEVVRYLVSHEELEVITDISELGAEDVFGASLTAIKGAGDPLDSLFVWIDGQHLVGANVLEIGCGTGLLGKQIGKVAQSYLGIDYSPLALRIAQLTSPESCTYYQISELEGILCHVGTIDAMVGRHFFIHQNFDNVLWLLRLAHALLRPGGIVSADFYLTNPEIPQGVVHPARAELDGEYASCAFAFTTDDIHEAAGHEGFDVTTIVDRPDVQRRLALLSKA